MPPPRRRSTSALPRDTRSSAVVDTSFRGIGLRPAPGTDTASGRFPVTTSFSTIVFHSPQAGHLPIHLEYSLPQFEQNHTVFAFVVPFTAISVVFRSAKIQKKDIVPSRDNISSQ